MEKQSLYGMFRALVVNNKDPQKFGRVMVWIPALMPTVSQTEGIWARAANNPIGGRNTESNSDNHYVGTSYIPAKGSWLFIFFEGGNINSPYYFGALDLENTKVLPENQLGSNYEKKWTLIKSHEGRAIIVSDDSSDARVELTGKKKQLSSPPTGNTSSVYTIDGNQTSILLDERSGKEKVLIRTHKGDFIHIDIDDRKLQASFEGDIIIKTNGNLQITAGDNINIKSKSGDINVQSEGNINLKAASDIIEQSGGDVGINSGSDLFLTSAGKFHGVAGSEMNLDATQLNEQSGSAEPAGNAGDAAEASPAGERDT